MNENHEDVHIGIDGEPEVNEPIVRIGYTHKTIANFCTGVDDPNNGHHRFQFHNHIMTLEGTQAEVDALDAEFKGLYRGMMPVDKINIKRLKVVQNEEEVISGPEAIRGLMGTHQVADKPVDQTPASPIPQRRVGGFSLPSQNR